MFFLFGRGRQFLTIRLAIVAVFVLAGVIFHRRGGAYWSIVGLRYVVIAAIIGVVVWRKYAAKRAGDTTGAADSLPEAPPFGSSFGQTRFGDAPAPAYGSSSVEIASTPPQVTPIEAAGTAGISAQSPAPALGPVGWHSDPSNPQVQHYWDGARWTHQVHWNGTGWVPAR